MGEFGLTLDLGNTFIYGWGNGLPQQPAGQYDLEYMLNTNLGVMGRGYDHHGIEDYAVGLEAGTSYIYSDEYDRSHNILGWNAGLRLDSLLKNQGHWSGGFRVSAGYKGERYGDGSVEHGFYASAMFIGNRVDDNACRQVYQTSLLDNGQIETLAYPSDISCARRSQDIVYVKEVDPDCLRELQDGYVARVSYCNDLSDAMERERQTREEQFCPSIFDQYPSQTEYDMRRRYINYCSFLSPPDSRSCEVTREYNVIDPSFALSLGIGMYVAYFPESGRGEAGPGFIIGFDPFFI